MQKCKQLCLLVCLVLMLLMSQTLWGQFVIKINATDGSGITDTVTLAVNALGTTSFDSLSPSFREYEIPVHAFGLDFRVGANLPEDDLLLGSYTSIHHLYRPSQSDNWKLLFNVDSGRTSLLVKWPAGLGALGGGFWLLRANPADPISFPDVDMTTQTSFAIPVEDNLQHSFYIGTGDGQKYRSFTATEIAFAHDSKDKPGKAEKRKPYASEGTYTFTNSTLPPGPKNGIHIEWGQGINSSTLSMTPSTTSPTGFSDAPKNVKLDITFASDIADGGSATIFAQGNKGKQLVAKKYWWTTGAGAQTPPGIKSGPVAPSSGDRLLLKMPNINNIGEELYTQAVFGANGITVGDPVNKSGVNGAGKDIIKAVINPKWSVVVKTLNVKGNVHDQGPTCLDNLVGPKPIEKVQKGLPPTKHDNVLLADAIALRFNIGAGDGHKIEQGGTTFGDLIYVKQAGDPNVPAVQKVRQIADKLDSMMRCLPVSWGGSSLAWDAMIQRINSAFSTPVFDTLSFGNPATTVAKGIKRMLDVSYLYRTSFADMLPSYNAPNIKALEDRNQPKEFALAQNYPNPFNPTTTIEFALSEDAYVTLKIYNMLGEEVATLVDYELMDEGTNEVEFDAARMASGVYYYRMIINDGQFQQIKKMVLVK